MEEQLLFEIMWELVEENLFLYTALAGIMACLENNYFI